MRRRLRIIAGTVTPLQRVCKVCGARLESGPREAWTCHTVGCARLVCDECAYQDEERRRFCPEHAYPLIWRALEDELDADYVVTTPNLAEMQVDLYSLQWLAGDEKLEETASESEDLWAELWEHNAADLPRSLRERVRADFVPEGERFKMVVGVRLEGLRSRDFVLLRERILRTIEEFLE